MFKLKNKCKKWVLKTKSINFRLLPTVYIFFLPTKSLHLSPLTGSCLPYPFPSSPLPSHSFSFFLCLFPLLLSVLPLTSDLPSSSDRKLFVPAVSSLVLSPSSLVSVSSFCVCQSRKLKGKKIEHTLRRLAPSLLTLFLSLSFSLHLNITRFPATFKCISSPLLISSSTKGVLPLYWIIAKKKIILEGLILICFSNKIEELFLQDLHLLPLPQLVWL